MGLENTQVDADLQLSRVVGVGDDHDHVTISLHGGQVLSWVAAGREQLYLSKYASASPGKSIRGGIPIIFPQFADAGTGPRHGFARTASWVLIGISRSYQHGEIAIGLTDSEASRQVWPHRFSLIQTVRLREQSLQVELHLTNTDAEAWAFSAALHSYWRITPGSEIQLGSLAGRGFVDRSEGGDDYSPHEPLRLGPEIERLYDNVSPDLEIDLDRRLYFSNEGWSDLMIWNPGVVKARSLPDLTPGDETAFICLEPLNLTPILLAPGDTWRGTHTIHLSHDSITQHI